ncbi:MAG: DUF488 domain-containing protein [Roseofilum sp. SID2]|uniref:DUF488 domain-containing protein n=2 Tax=unclassified Roseofilum TaxID=2620099 RepID=UPI001B03E54D|nr:MULTISPECIES: DUF488 domain-containing protein [unclassified Roseofilum]MBP0026530.1 DUF488 domain-containing protein [Roseofilum sp. SID2]MBP0036232.1 DUF488 domain-containing protein [Roseofilum sp. SID1]
MLYRQRILLKIIQKTGGNVSLLQLMKWSFLLHQETPSGGGSTFYGFIPYLYGPYSFTLNREVDVLVRNGFLKKQESNRWQLTPVGQQQEVRLPNQIHEDISTVINEYGKLSISELKNTVYHHYPWFTINSTIDNKCKPERPIAPLAIYTAGYEKKTVDDFLNLLMQSGIQKLIDVRYNPIARRYGFHKSTLQKLCHSLDIDYQHLPGLGIPGAARKNLNSSDRYQSLFEGYRSNLCNCPDDIETVISLLTSQPSVLVCMEANPECCHRNILAQYIAGIINLPIEHLRYS